MNATLCLRAGPERPGFTLIELMAVIAIAALLTAASLPSFRQQVLKSRCAEAREALLAVQLAQEQHRSRQPRYANRLDALGQPDLTRNGLYRLRAWARSPCACCCWQSSASARPGRSANWPPPSAWQPTTSGLPPPRRPPKRASPGRSPC